jgi:hypothetical protein
MQSPERKLRLRFDADRTQRSQIRRGLDRVIEQRRLPDPGLPPHDQSAAFPGPGSFEQAVQHRTFILPVPEDHSPGVD